MNTQVTESQPSTKELIWIDQLLAWHKSSREHDPGELAQLRRCTNPHDAVFHHGFHRLRQRILGAGAANTIDPQRLCLIAVLAAHTKQHQPWPSLGSGLVGQGPQIPLVNEHRLRQLCSEHDRLQGGKLLVRMLPLFKHVVDLAKLAKLLFFWGDDARRKLALDYYDHLFPHIPKKGDRS